MQEKILLSSFNCRGLGDGRKRRTIFQWLKKYHSGVILLQETHSTRSSENEWKREWGGDIYFNHGSSLARGVAVLFPKHFNVTVDNCIRDDNGRFLLLDINCEDYSITIGNIYAPTKDHEAEQITFIEYVRDRMFEFGDKNIVLGGDFNVCIEPAIDKCGGTNELKSAYAHQIEDLLELYNLCDIWRTLHPDIRRYTRRGFTKKGFVQSRLDMWFISIHMTYDIENTDIKPGIRSDHSILNLSFKIQNTQERGRGFWKFNASLLHDIEYVEKIRRCIAECSESNKGIKDKAMLWDVIKCEIRTVTISYACYKAKQRKELENTILKRLENLETAMAAGNDTCVEEHQALQREFEAIQQEKAKGIMIRSRAEILDNDEKCSKYFLNLEKRNYKTKYIKCLINAEDKYIHDPHKILKEEEMFYKSLYEAQSDQIEHNLTNCDFLQNLKQLDDTSKAFCEQALTVEELALNLRQLPNNKSPGCDGLGTEFYKFFWKDIKQLVFESYMYSFDVGTLSLDQRRAILNIIPKPNKDLRHLKNWRPLSLLNTDYKILTKTLSARLQNVIGDIVSGDQTGCIKGRYIGENIRTVIDLLQYTSMKDIPGYMLLLDFEKAFDSVSWQFLHKTLELCNFGEFFRTWIKVIYSDPKICVTNNGYASSFFSINRGIRQGCPISALLFLLVVESFAEKIRNNSNIKGIKVKNEEIIISQFADDTTLFLCDEISVKNVLEVLEHYSKCAGLKINKSKSEVIKLGKSVANLPDKICGLRIISKPTKVLGIWVSKDLDELLDINFNERITKLKTLLNMWKQRKLTLKGKVTVINSLALSQIQYAMSVLYVPPNVISEVNQLIFAFLWPKKTHVKRSTVIGKLEDGGLKMPDFEYKVKSFKVMWVQRLLNNTKIAAMVENMGLPATWEELCKSNFDVDLLRNFKCCFYKQILECWYELYSKSPTNVIEVRSQRLWLNKFICVNNKPLYNKVMLEKSLKYVNDIFDNTGTYISLNQLNGKFNIEMDVMTYNSLKDAIPRSWRKIVKNSHGIQVIDEIKVQVNKIEKKLESITSKELYWHFINNKYKRGTAMSKWEDIFDLVHLEWEEIFSIPYKVARETNLQSLQYQIIHRFFPCNEILGTWYNDHKTTCDFCNQEDSIQHFFYECNVSKTFWKHFSTWWHSVTLVNLNVNLYDIIFGVMNPSSDTMIDALNYCILLGKRFISTQKKTNKDCFLYYYQIELRQMLELEKYICVEKAQEKKFTKRWSFIYENL